MKERKYIILEIVPTAVDPTKGEIAQLSALKIDGLKLISRFDYRLDESKVNNEFILRMFDYDKEKFKYVETTKGIIKNFKEFCEDLDLLIIDNQYTENYLKDFNNHKESIFNYLNMKYSDEVINEIIRKYDLEPSNYIVDLLYEALIYEENKR